MKIKIIALIIFISTSLFAQHEALVPMQFNPGIKQHLRNHPEELQQRVHSPGDTLALPFTDDFSLPGIYPDANKWTDKGAFINTDLAQNPPTLGVATFDGADAYGNAYNSVNTNLSGSSDTLTSKPINLQYAPGDSIYLSFFYEKAGWGIAPAGNDSLILEFYNPGIGWSRQWFTKAVLTTGNDTFYKVNLPIVDPVFLYNGFQFRFRNHGSLSGAIDLWHLDYVMLKSYGAAGLSNDIIDIAFTNRVISLTTPYTSMPWKWLKTNISTYQLSSLTTHYRNLSSSFSFNDINFKDKVYRNSPVHDSTRFFRDTAVVGNVQALTENTRQININSPLLILQNYDDDSSVFFTTHELYQILNGDTIAPDGLRTNDSIVSRYEFYNYYSYDDGTSEAGYDLVSAPGGKLAMRFDLAQPDTLRAVRMLFVQQNGNVSNKLFNLKIWSSLSPEVPLYTQQNLKPTYTDSIDGMATFVIPPLPVSGQIYVGFQQSAADGLHLGFDRNTANNNRMFYNVGGTWTNVSVAPGSFMIRIVMGDSNLFVGLNETSQNQSYPMIYPNPASDFIYCNTGNNSSFNNVNLYDATGRIIFSKKVAENFTIDVRNLSSGFYMLHIYDKDHQTAITKKILIRH